MLRRRALSLNFCEREFGGKAVWNSRVSRNTDCCCFAGMEKEHALKHCGRDCIVYAAASKYVKNLQKLCRKNCAISEKICCNLRVSMVIYQSRI